MLLDLTRHNGLVHMFMDARKLQKLLLLTALCAQGARAGGAGAPGQPPGPPPQNRYSTKPFVLTPLSLRKELLEKNFNVLYGGNRVHQSRMQVDNARNALLPSLNLSFLAYGTHGAALAAADFLLGFLVPSKWFDLARQKENLQAEEQAYYILKLNQYNSGLNMYYGLSSDMQLRNFLVGQINDAQELEILAEEALQEGFGTEIDLEQASAQVSESRSDYLRVQSLLENQIGQLKMTMGFRQDQEFYIDYVELSPSKLESMSEKRAFETAFWNSPELKQVNHLLDASDKNLWSSVFGFVNNFTASGAAGAGGSSAFSNLDGHGSLNLGFTQISQYKLAKAEKQNIQIRKRELQYEMERVVYTALRQLALAQEAVEEAQYSMGQQESIYEKQKEFYLDGRLGFSELLQTRQRMQRAKLAEVQSRASLQILRASLQRMGREGLYYPISGCYVSRMSPSELNNYVKANYSIERICQISR